jgi:NitT/TauT family transport system permease protein
MLLIGWAIFATLPRYSAVVPSPWSLLVELQRLILEGYSGTPLWSHFRASLLRTMSGFLLGALTGTVVGLLMGYSRIIGSALAPFFAFVRPIPAIAYIPILILLFGIGEASKILVILVAAFLYVSMNTSAGVKSVPGDLIRVGQSFGASRQQLFFYIIVPETLPHVALGLRIGLALSWAVVVAAELVAAQQGLGYMIMDASTFFRIEVVYVGVILIGLVGLTLESMLLWAERKIIHWSGH